MVKKLSTFEKEMKNSSFKEEFNKQYKELLLSELIVELMAKEGKSIRQLALSTDLSTNSINKIRTGKQKDLKLRNFLSITHACGYTVSLEKGKQKIKLDEMMQTHVKN